LFIISFDTIGDLLKSVGVQVECRYQFNSLPLLCANLTY